MPEKEKPGPLVEPTKPFNLFLGSIEGGALHDDLSDEVRELNAALSEYAASNGVAKGSITIKLNFVLEKAGTLDVTADIATKTPKTKRERTVLWLTPGNNTSTENPKQVQMFPRRTAVPEQPPVAVPDAPAATRKV